TAAVSRGPPGAQAGVAVRGVVLEPVLSDQGGRGLARFDRPAPHYARALLLRGRRGLEGRDGRGPVALWLRRSALRGVGANGTGLAQRHDEAAAGRRACHVARVAAVPARDLADQRQAQPGPGALAGSAESMEGLEHAFTLGVGNARPVIGDA